MTWIHRKRELQTVDVCVRPKSKTQSDTLEINGIPAIVHLLFVFSFEPKTYTFKWALNYLREISFCAIRFHISLWNPSVHLRLAYIIWFLFFYFFFACLLHSIYIYLLNGIHCVNYFLFSKFICTNIRCIHSNWAWMCGTQWQFNVLSTVLAVMVRTTNSTKCICHFAACRMSLSLSLLTRDLNCNKHTNTA